MTLEGKNSGISPDNNGWPISGLDILVAVAKRMQQRALAAGRTTIPIPYIDKYLEQKQREAGSPEERRL